MKIWEPKLPGTLLATPGLLRESFTFTNSSEGRKLKVFPVRSNEDREMFAYRWLGICPWFSNRFTAGLIRAVKRRELDGWCLVSGFVATLQAKVRDKPVLPSLFTVPSNDIKWNSLGETSPKWEKSKNIHLTKHQQKLLCDV
jgi:hypothetical protein